MRKEASGLPAWKSELLAQWQEFYKEHGIEKSLSRIVIPTRHEGFNRLIVVLAGMTSNRLFAKCKEFFPSWRYAEDFDQIRSDREPDHDYAIWVRCSVEADEDMNGLSVNDTKTRGIIGIALHERLLYGLKYFRETRGHLDPKNVTLCSGSRYLDGGVPGVYSSDDRMFVGWYSPGNSHELLRVRAVVPQHLYPVSLSLPSE